MIDLKRFRKENNLKQTELAEFFGVSFGFISQIERGERKLSEAYENMLQNNNRGWVVPEGGEAIEQLAIHGKTAQNWPEIVADLAAKVGEQNAQIGRLLTIVEQLTAQKK